MTTPDEDRSTEALIVAASRLASPKSAPQPKKSQAGAAGLAALLVAGAAIAYVATRPNDHKAVPVQVSAVPTAVFDTTPTTTVPPSVDTTPIATDASVIATSTVASAISDPVTTTSVSEVTTTAPQTTAPQTTVAETTTTVAQVVVLASAGTGNTTANPTNYGVYKGGKLYLVGAVATAEMALDVRAKAEAVLGHDAVVGDVAIDPAAGPPTGLVRADSGVLFASNSWQIGDEFKATMDLVVVALTISPQAELEIYGHTDSVGTDESNQRLSAYRVRAMTDYLAFKGIDIARLHGFPMGETTPIADNGTPEGRQQNRRIDVVFLKLF